MKSFLKNSSLIVIILGLATFLAYLFQYLSFQEATIIIIYMLAVIIISQLTSHYAYGLSASFISVMAFNFFFTHPLFTFNFSQPDYLFTFFVMFVASFLSSSLTSKLKNERNVSEERTKQVLLMEAINKVFQNYPIQNALNESARLIAEAVDGNVTLVVNFESMELRAQVLDHQEDASYRKHMITLDLGGKTIGSMTLSVKQQVSSNWLTGLAMILSQNIEKIDLIERQNQAEMRIREQKLRNNLLGAISHDLRTPLATIIGSSDTLIENREGLNDDDQRLLLNNIREDATWLMNSVENILSFMRVDEGIQLNIQNESIEELFGDVVSRALSHTDSKIELSLPKDPVFYPMDIQLMEKVLLNLIDNAIKYSSIDSKIRLKATIHQDELIFEVSDEGPGIPDEEKKHIFERFYTVKRDDQTHRRGLGLGLAICKSIVEAHHGIIIAKNNKPTGTTIRCIFPYPGGQRENPAD